IARRDPRLRNKGPVPSWELLRTALGVGSEPLCRSRTLPNPRARPGPALVWAQRFTPRRRLAGHVQAIKARFVTECGELPTALLEGLRYENPIVLQLGHVA